MAVDLTQRWPILANWKFFFVLAMPVILIPLLVIEDKTELDGKLEETSKFRCAYVIILMAIYWMVEALPLAITSLLPVVLFPLFGVESTANICINYMKETNMMFVGGIIIALAVEYCHLHKRIALRVIMIIGTSPIRIMLGVMLTTMFLSMWISNTATTAMMVPIVMAVLEELNKTNDSYNRRISTMSRGGLPENEVVGQDTTKQAPFDTEIDVSSTGGSSEALDTDTRVKVGAEVSGGVNLGGNEDTKNLKIPLLLATLTAANIGGIFLPYSALASKIYYKLITGPVLKDSVGLREFHPASLLFAVAYSSNLGGTGTFTGTAVNLILKSKLSELTALKRNQKLMYLFATAYASNIGGTGVVTGTAPSLIAYQFLKPLDISQGGKYLDITFATWMGYNVPTMLLNVLVAWSYLVVLYFGIPDELAFWRSKSAADKAAAKAKAKDVSKMLRKEYDRLGPMSFHEAAIALLFFIVVMLWMFRDPRFIDGWGTLFKEVEVDDSTAAMLIVFILFVIPKDPSFLFGKTPKETGTLLDWKYVQSHLPWGVVLLMGGGFAMSDAAEKSHLSDWIGQQLNGLRSLPDPAIVIIVMIMTAAVTEVASNAACANVIVPILISLSKRLALHPLYLTLPAAISCSFAFMLPVATPPNAIVYAAAGDDMRIMDMVKTGAFLNVTCITVLFLMHISYGDLLFNFGNYVYADALNTTTVRSF